MKVTVKDKLERISDIWKYFIWDNKFCSSKIKFNDNIKTNYFGDVLAYFQDTLAIVFPYNKENKGTDKFTYTISFLQAIYIQQNFIQEMLEIFMVSIDKKSLDKDPTYYINRELRNELIGHPISKRKGALISSTLFSYKAREGEIQYLRYHKDNNFKFECKTFIISEIQEHHLEFLDKYFDSVLCKLKFILEEYILELDKYEIDISHQNFNSVLEFVDHNCGAIFQSDFAYEKDSLVKIYERKNKHFRYQNFINKFYLNLQVFLSDKRELFRSLFEEKGTELTSMKKFQLPKIKIVVINPEDRQEVNILTNENYHYEIGKLATSRNLQDFDFFGGILKAKFSNNKLILGELEHMKQNITNDIEYYTSLRYICLELKEE